MIVLAWLLAVLISTVPGGGVTANDTGGGFPLHPITTNASTTTTTNAARIAPAGDTGGGFPL